MNARVRECVYDAASAFAVDFTEVLSRSRLKTVTYARSTACVLLRERYGWSFPQIGKALGRDHTTVISAVNRAKQEPIASVVERLLNPTIRDVVRCAPCSEARDGACHHAIGYARCG